jgi:ribonuclease P protein component
MTKPFGLKRNKMMKSKKQFASLIASGKKVLKHPVLISFLWVEPIDEQPIKVAFSVSKKKVKKAVDRIKIKRLLREGYRLNQGKLTPILKADKQLLILFIYLNKEVCSFQLINESVENGLQKLIDLSAGRGDKTILPD